MPANPPIYEEKEEKIELEKELEHKFQTFKEVMGLKLTGKEIKEDKKEEAYQVGMSISRIYEALGKVSEREKNHSAATMNYYLASQYCTRAKEFSDTQEATPQEKQLEEKFKMAKKKSAASVDCLLPYQKIR